MMDLRKGLALTAAALMFAACDQAPTVPEDPFANLPKGIHPVLVTSQQGGEATVELHLRRVDVTEHVAGVQGELTFDASRLALEGAEFQAGSSGMWNPVADGRVRFAGVAVDGFSDTPVLTMHFQGSVRDAERAFGVKVEEITALEGFANQTSLVVAGARPLLVRN